MKKNKKVGRILELHRKRVKVEVLAAVSKAGITAICLFSGKV
jgi:hypothetical protein